MSVPFRHGTTSQHNVSSYTLRQCDANGQVLSEEQVAAHSYSAVLRELEEVLDEAHRIEVFDSEGEKAGEIGVDYWRRKRRRR